MTADAAVTREALFRTVGEQWQATEDAIAAVGAQFNTPAYEQWTVGDIFRHITASSHDAASQIRALLASGEFPFAGDEGNAAGVEKFQSLDYKMLRIELNTAHGVVWMYIQRFSDEDLAQTHSLMGTEMSLGQIIGLLAQHEDGHVADALKAAGVPESAVVPLETAHRWA